MLWRWADRRAGRAHRGADRAHGAGAAARRHRRPRTAASAAITASTGAACARRSTRPTTSAEMRGGSTITQQVAKNLFLWQGRSYVRKALELPLAVWIDLVLPKRRVLEIYLNIAEWGPNGRVRRRGGGAPCLRQVGPPAHAPARRRCWRRSCPTRRAAARASPGPTVRRLAGDLRGPRGRGSRRGRACIDGGRKGLVRR